ncbi:sulfite exporter TauE/SafE family protein [Bacillota bacterium LX-D]|nr:sulfite exporter TauE/SafE family protein [Bacillota bacterium LX-D]
MFNLVLIIIGLVAGTLSGLFGIGGGIIIIPALMYFCGFDQFKAQGTSLAILLPPVGILAFLEYYRKGNVDIKAAILICVAVLIGSMLGAKIVHQLPVTILKKGFALSLLFVAAKMFFSK